MEAEGVGSFGGEDEKYCEDLGLAMELGITVNAKLPDIADHFSREDVGRLHHDWSCVQLA